MAKPKERLSRYERAAQAFAKGAKNSERSSTFVGQCQQGGCTKPMTITETFRGASYRVTGTCPEGHSIERYGYAQEAEA